jgi:hypothetical protein
LNDEPLYRVCKRANGTWWPSNDGSGRFDLTSTPGTGTCYFGTDPHAAMYEVFRSLPVDPTDIHLRSLRLVTFGRMRVIADTTQESARIFGITKEIATIVPYDICHRWAACLHKASYEGIRHELRHDPVPRASGMSVFGPTGAAPDDFHEKEVTDLNVEDVESAGLRVLQVPSRRNVPVFDF